MIADNSPSCHVSSAHSEAGVTGALLGGDRAGNRTFHELHLATGRSEHYSHHDLHRLAGIEQSGLNQVRNSIAARSGSSRTGDWMPWVDTMCLSNPTSIAAALPGCFEEAIDNVPD